MNRLTEDDNERYRAHISLCEIDIPGQQRIRSARVAVVGAGALASTAILYLAAAGVGFLRIIDGDVVSLSNLQRQIIHSTPAIGEAKPLSAARRVRELNPSVEVDARCAMLSADNAETLLSDVDVVLDCTDNYQARLLVSRTCAALAKPLCFAALSRFEGQVTTFMPGSVTYADIFPTPPTAEQLECRSCAVTGVLNALAGIAGSMQAAEALKIIIGTGDLLVNRMILIDSLTFNFQTIRFNK